MQAEQSGIQKYVKVRPRPVRGRFQKLRLLAVFVLLGAFHLAPFLQWNGRQAILFDLASRRFFVFGLNIWPQDLILLVFVLISLVLILFFVTSIMGRVWCGYACPHTVYTEVFMWIEQKVEGNRSEQLRIERLPWSSLEKWRKRGLKYFFWFITVLIVGIGFVGYFTPIRALIVDFFTLKASPAAYFWVAFYGAFCWLQAGVVREIFCKYMCPYARFQGAMFDRDTLIIAYDKARGEPRRRLKKADREHPENLGFCVDCTMCVQVCPTGIDIRDGLQLGCIACAACIDACDNMMTQINAPKGLIRYTSTASLAGEKTRFLRPKTVAYAFVLLGVFVSLTMAIILKSDFEMDILPDRNMLSKQIRGGMTQNSFTVKVLNKTESARAFEIGIEGLDGAQLQGQTVLSLPASEVQEVVLSVNVPTKNLNGRLTTKFYFTLTPQDAPTQVKKKESNFTGPMRR